MAGEPTLRRAAKPRLFTMVFVGAASFSVTIISPATSPSQPDAAAGTLTLTPKKPRQARRSPLASCPKRDPVLRVAPTSPLFMPLYEKASSIACPPLIGFHSGTPTKLAMGDREFKIVTFIIVGCAPA
eukprot:scaffold271879_cov30-Tisochrysis_lutea.AAC.4